MTEFTQFAGRVHNEKRKALVRFLSVRPSVRLFLTSMRYAASLRFDPSAREVEDMPSLLMLLFTARSVL